MKTYNQFHDGEFEGLWINGKTAHIFLATDEKERYVIVADRLDGLVVNDIRAGNIIFEVLERPTEEVTLQDMYAVHYLGDGALGEGHAHKAMQQVHMQKERILEINPSYGASCLILAGSLNLISQDDWLKRYGFGLPLTSPER